MQSSIAARSTGPIAEKKVRASNYRAAHGTYGPFKGPRGTSYQGVLATATSAEDTKWKKENIERKIREGYEGEKFRGEEDGKKVVKVGNIL